MEEKNDQPIRFSVVIPAYNEEERIAHTVRAVAAYLAGKGIAFEIIVVDDGSRDGTARQCAAVNEAVTLVKNRVNRGKGYSVRKGVLAACGDLVLFSDADLSTPIQEMDKFWNWFDDGYDIVIGSRALPESDIRIRQPWYRETMGKTFNLFVRMLAVPGITDTQCGFKCFTRKAAAAVFSRQRINRWGFDPEILFIARKQGFRIKDIPVTWLNRPQSKVHIVGAPLEMLMDLLRIRANDLLKKYD